MTYQLLDVLCTNTHPILLVQVDRRPHSRLVDLQVLHCVLKMLITAVRLLLLTARL